MADFSRRAKQGDSPPLMLKWTCLMCGWTTTVAAPGFAGDGRDHFPTGRTPCGPITAQRDVHYLSPSGADLQALGLTPDEIDETSNLPAAMRFADLLAAEFSLREVLDDDDASDAVVCLREHGFTIIATQELAESALVQEGLRDV